MWGKTAITYVSTLEMSGFTASCHKTNHVMCWGYLELAFPPLDVWCQTSALMNRTIVPLIKSALKLRIDPVVERKHLYHHLPYSTARIPLKLIPVPTSSPAFSASPAIIANRKWCGWRVASVGWSQSNIRYQRMAEWHNSFRNDCGLILFDSIKKYTSIHFKRFDQKSQDTHVTWKIKTILTRTFSISAHDRPFEQRLKGCLRQLVWPLLLHVNLLPMKGMLQMAVLTRLGSDPSPSPSHSSRWRDPTPGAPRVATFSHTQITDWTYEEWMLMELLNCRFGNHQKL